MYICVCVYLFHLKDDLSKSTKRFRYSQVIKILLNWLVKESEQPKGKKRTYLLCTVQFSSCRPSISNESSLLSGHHRLSVDRKFETNHIYTMK